LLNDQNRISYMLCSVYSLHNETYLKYILFDTEDLGRSLSPFVKDLPGLRKEYREIRRGPAVPIVDVKRICVPGDFIEVLESTKPSGELISTFLAILGAEMSVEAVC